MDLSSIFQFNRNSFMRQFHQKSEEKKYINEMFSFNKKAKDQGKC